jgi:sensor c-di-GMP phosphodiesterase-like protein
MTALVLNISRNAIVIPETVIVSIPDADQLNVSDVNIYTVDSSANTRRQLRNQQVSLTAGATEVGSINVNYTVTIKSMTKDYAYFANELRTAVVNQLFTLQMRLIADQYDASAFYNATSSNVTIIAVVTPETKKTTEQEFYQTYVVPLAIGLIFILSMALFIGFICCMRRQKSIQKKYRVHIDTDNNSEHG